MSTHFNDDAYEAELGGKDEDVSRPFLIVARQIESMAVSPTERQSRMIEKIARMIAIEQTQDEKKSSYPGVYYNPELFRYEAWIYKKKSKKLIFVSEKEHECITELKKYKKEHGL